MGIGSKIVNKMFKNSKGEWSKMAMAGTGANLYFGASEYADKRAEGEGMISAGLSAAGDIALGILTPMPLYIGAMMAPALAEGAVDAYHALDQYGRQLKSQRRNLPFQNATFVDSQQTYTMRQAGMNLARQGQMAAQQTSMGNEASAFARY